MHQIKKPVRRRRGRPPNAPFSGMRAVVARVFEKEAVLGDRRAAILEVAETGRFNFEALAKAVSRNLHLRPVVFSMPTTKREVIARQIELAQQRLIAIKVIDKEIDRRLDGMPADVLVALAAVVNRPALLAYLRKHRINGGGIFHHRFIGAVRRQLLSGKRRAPRVRR